MKTKINNHRKIKAIILPVLGVFGMLLFLNCSKDSNPESDPIITSDVLVSTLAGSSDGYMDGVGANAQFLYPLGITADALGNIYVAERNAKIRKITFNVTVTTFAGTTVGDLDGPANVAKFDDPYDIDIDASGNMYIADNGNNKIRKINPNGVVSTLAGGFGATGGFKDGDGEYAKFHSPTGLVVDGQGNVFVADWLNNRIRKITPNGFVSTFAGGVKGDLDGTGTNAQLHKPYDITMDPQGNFYITDEGNFKVKKITSNGIVTTIAGSTPGYADGEGAAAQFMNLKGIAIDHTGNFYVADMLNNKIRKITSQGIVSTVAGSIQGYLDESGDKAQFNRPSGIALDATDKIYVADFLNHKVRKIVKAK